MHRRVEPPDVSGRSRTRSTTSASSSCCASIGHGPVDERVVAVDRADLGDQRPELRLQLVEDLAHLGGLHPRLVVVQQRRRTARRPLEALDVAAPQLDVRARGAAGTARSRCRSRAFAQTSWPRAAARVISARSSVGTRRAFSQSRRVTRTRRRVVRVVLERLLEPAEPHRAGGRSRPRRTARGRSGRAS